MKHGYWILRLLIKDAIAFVGLGPWLIEYCERCGIEQPLTWWADNDLWLELTGNETPPGDNASGCYCPRCFDDLARRRGVLLRWYPKRHG